MNRNTMIELGYLPKTSNPNTYTMELKIYDTENSLRKKLSGPKITIGRAGAIVLNRDLIELLDAKQGDGVIIAGNGNDWYIARSTSSTAFHLRKSGEVLAINCAKLSNLMFVTAKTKSDVKTLQMSVLPGVVHESGLDLHLIVLPAKQ
jgi:hypothetical protein